MSGSRRIPAVVLLLSVMGLIGVACSRSDRTATSTSAPEATPAPAASGPALGPGGSEPGDLQLVSIGPKIIKNASMDLEIKDQTFEQRAQDVILIASRHGGFVTSSRTSGGKHLSGTMVIRVPAAQFEVALGELKGLGKVTGEQIAGEDVTAQFVDLDARLRNWEAQETVLLRLMDKSASIEDSLKVQRSLQDVQLAIEEIKGQLRLLTDQADMSTITLSMAEQAAVVPPKKTNAFLRAWHRGLDATVGVFTAIVIGVGFLAPLFLLVLAGGLVWLLFRRLRPKAPVPS